MHGQRRAAAVLGLALLGSACGMPGGQQPAGEVTITGTAITADDSPTAGATAILVSEAGLAEAADTGGPPLAAVGVACLAPAPPDFCDAHVHRTVADADGRFAFGFSGAGSRAMLGSAVHVTVGLPPADGQQAGASTSQQLTVGGPDIRLSPVMLWEPAVTLAATPTGVDIAWEPFPSRFGMTPAYRLRFTDVRGNPVWTMDSPPTTASIDGRLLEDFLGGVGVEVARRSTAPGTRVDLVFRSPQPSLSGPAGQPPSRRQVCTVFRSGAPPVVLTPCPLTDGDFSAATVVQATCPADAPCTGPDDTFVVIDVAAERDVSLVVLRGTAAEYLIEGSVDGLEWAQLARTRTSGDAAVPLSPGARARYVRVRAPSGPLPALAEISVW